MDLNTAFRMSMELYLLEGGFRYQRYFSQQE